MFVVMIIQTYEPYPFIGGAERQLANLARRMDAKGVKVHILTRRYPGLKAFEKIDGIPVQRLPAAGPKVIASLLFTASALPILWRLKPDIIHAHELLSPTTTAVVAKRLFGVPVVAKVLAGGPIGDVARMGNRFGGPARLEMFRRDVDVFVSVSSEIDDELEAWGVLASRRARIPNGVDTRTFHPVAPDTQREIRNKLNLPKSPLVVYAGRLAPEKQIDRLLAIWPSVRASVTEASLLILGAGPEENNLRRQAGEGVTFFGRVDDVASYFKAADLFVLPSRREGLSNAMLEAMASGLPVVSSDATGARDAIRDRVNGRLVPQNDPVELKQTIVELLLDEEQCVRLGCEARATVESEFSIESTCQQLCDLYGSVIQQTNLAPEQAIRSES